MPSFRYQALNAKQELVSGEVQADGVQQALSQLEASGLTVQAIGYASSAPAPEGPFRAIAGAAGAALWKTASLDASIEQAVLQSHLKTVLEQGKSLVPALRAYADEMPSSRRRRQLRTVCSILDHGNAVDATSAFADLPEYWVPLLTSAASSSDPGQALREFLEESQRAAELRRQWWLTLAYPVIVAGTAAGVLTLLSFLVIPAFRDIFYDFDLDLPGPTRLVLSVSGWITSGQALVAAVLLIALVALLASTRRVLPSPIIAWLGDRISGVFGRSTAIAQFARFTADLLDAGIDVPSALRIAGFAIRRLRLRQAGWRLAGDIEARRGAQRTDRRLLTATFLHALQSDMPASSRIRLLKELSCCHADRARHRLSWTRGIIEPITIGVIGLLVGGIVIGLFLPLITVVTLLSG